MKDRRILSYLIDSLLNGSVSDSFYRGRDETVGMIAALGDKRTIVTMMGRVDDDVHVSRTHYPNGDRTALRKGDLAMAVVLRQTRQNLSGYGFYRGEWVWEDDVTGFETNAKRKAARAKLRKWWAKHKDKDYAGVKKVALP